MLEKLFKVRKGKYADYPGLIPELDLVEEADKITHEVSLDDEEVGTKQSTHTELDQFAFDENYEENEAEWDEIRQEILGEEAYANAMKEEERADGTQAAEKQSENEGE